MVKVRIMRRGFSFWATSLAAPKARDDILHQRGVWDKSPNRPASSARPLVIEATYTL
jgi:hypothetical protein